MQHVCVLFPSSHLLDGVVPVWSFHNSYQHVSSAFSKLYRGLHHLLLHVPSCKHFSSHKDQRSASWRKVQAWTLKQSILWKYKHQKKKSSILKLWTRGTALMKKLPGRQNVSQKFQPQFYSPFWGRKKLFWLQMHSRRFHLRYYTCR